MCVISVGFYQNGRNNIPITERARRIYMPGMLPFEGGRDHHPSFADEHELNKASLSQRPMSQGTQRQAKNIFKKNRGDNNKGKGSREYQKNKFETDFNNYYDRGAEGLFVTPLNGVGDTDENVSDFQHFLVSRQGQGGGNGSSSHRTRWACIPSHGRTCGYS